MMRTTHKTALVVIPPESEWPPIQAIRAEHDRKVGRWMPHLTLVYPFLLASECMRAVRRLGPACAALRPFELRLARFDTFRHHRDSDTAWLKPEPEGPLTICSGRSGRPPGRGKRRGPPGAASART